MTDDDTDTPRMLIHAPGTETEAEAMLNAARRFGDQLEKTRAAQERLHAALEAYENEND